MYFYLGVILKRITKCFHAGIINMFVKTHLCFSITSCYLFEFIRHLHDTKVNKMGNNLLQFIKRSFMRRVSENKQSLFFCCEKDCNTLLFCCFVDNQV